MNEELRHELVRLTYSPEIVSFELTREQGLEILEEIERLKQGYCELKEKCNKGECDCTHEEYNGMCEENIKMDLEIERLNNILDTLMQDMALLNATSKKEIKPKYVFDRIATLRGVDKE